MDILVEGVISDIVSTDIDASFPVTNVLDNHPKRLWKSTSSISATISFEYAVGNPYLYEEYTHSDPCIALFNVHAASVTVRIYEDNTKAVLVATDTKTGSTSTTDVNLLFTFTNYLYLAYDRYIEIDFDFIIPEVAKCGIIRVGNLVALGKVKRDLKIKRKDYSIKRFLQNGSLYYYKKNTVRSFDGGIVVNNANDPNLSAVYDIYEAYGQTPLVIRIVDDSSGNLFVLPASDYLVFGYIDDDELSIDEGAFSSDSSTWNFRITEQI